MVPYKLPYKLHNQHTSTQTWRAKPPNSQKIPNLNTTNSPQAQSQPGTPPDHGLRIQLPAQHLTQHTPQSPALAPAPKPKPPHPIALTPQPRQRGQRRPLPTLNIPITPPSSSTPPSISSTGAQAAGPSAPELFGPAPKAQTSPVPVSSPQGKKPVGSRAMTAPTPRVKKYTGPERGEERPRGGREMPGAAPRVKKYSGPERGEERPRGGREMPSAGPSRPAKSPDLERSEERPGGSRGMGTEGEGKGKGVMRGMSTRAVLGEQDRGGRSFSHESRMAEMGEEDRERDREFSWGSQVAEKGDGDGE